MIFEDYVAFVKISFRKLVSNNGATQCYDFMNDVVWCQVTCFKHVCR